MTPQKALSDLHSSCYTAQSWDGDTCVVSIHGLSLDAAREVVRAHLAFGLTGRVMANAFDYCEVYPHAGGDVRCGTFAETTLVKACREHDQDDEADYDHAGSRL